MTEQTLHRRRRLVLYPETPTRRARQMATDILLLAWVGAWAWLAVKLHEQVTKLGAIGDTIHDTGQRIADNIATVQDKLHNLPLIGGQASEPLNRAGAAARSLASAGQAEQGLVDNLAITLVVLLLIGPAALVALRWLPRRIRWITQATTAAKLRDHPAGTDLLALRALATQPLRKLAKLNTDPAAAWRHRQPAAVHTLAALELRRYGLRPAAQQLPQPPTPLDEMQVADPPATK
ncbi:hypothetical protein [Actinomadura sp. 6N118]|uniref:hypothetical protein n=1 Tax=Actinomadura sp. 6N118 TaxID=3375151 RepID=UPI0037AC8722